MGDRDVKAWPDRATSRTRSAPGPMARALRASRCGASDHPASRSTPAGEEVVAEHDDDRADRGDDDRGNVDPGEVIRAWKQEAGDEPADHRADDPEQDPADDPRPSSPVTKNPARMPAIAPTTIHETIPILLLLSAAGRLPSSHSLPSCPAERARCPFRARHSLGIRRLRAAHEPPRRCTKAPRR